MNEDDASESESSNNQCQLNNNSAQTHSYTKCLYFIIICIIYNVWVHC